MPNSVSDALFIYCGGVGRTRGGGWGSVQIGIFVVFQWTHSFTPPFPSCCPHCHHCRRRIYSNIFEYLHRRIYSYSYSVDIFKPNIFVFVFGFYFWVEYIRIRIRFLFLKRIYSYSYSVVKMLFAHLWTVFNVNPWYCMVWYCIALYLMVSYVIL